MTDEKQGSKEVSLLALRPQAKSPRAQARLGCTLVLFSLLNTIATVFLSICFFNFGIPDLPVMI